MREIKFRGKSLDNNEWVFGYYAHHEDVLRHRETHGIYSDHADSMPESKGYSFYPDFEVVNPETVGQFTGLLDKNGKEIYEGDILAVTGVSERLEVRFVRGVFAFLYNGNLDDECPLNAPTHCCVGVIGNIHDNPELLKGGKK